MYRLRSVRTGLSRGCHRLVAADCTAYAYGNFHNEFIRGKVCLVGCPKLDSVDYAEKLTAAFWNDKEGEKDRAGGLFPFYPVLFCDILVKNPWEDIV